MSQTLFSEFRRFQALSNWFMTKNECFWLLPWPWSPPWFDAISWYYIEKRWTASIRSHLNSHLRSHQNPLRLSKRRGVTRSWNGEIIIHCWQFQTAITKKKSPASPIRSDWIAIWRWLLLANGADLPVFQSGCTWNDGLRKTIIINKLTWNPNCLTEMAFKVNTLITQVVVGQCT